jgi:hypothetical protein
MIIYVNKQKKLLTITKREIKKNEEMNVDQDI